MLFAGIAFVVVVAIAMFVARERLAHLEAILAGGTISPACVIAEAVDLVVLAAVLFAISRHLGLR